MVPSLLRDPHRRGLPLVRRGRRRRGRGRGRDARALRRHQRGRRHVAVLHQRGPRPHRRCARAGAQAIAEEKAGIVTPGVTEVWCWARPTPSCDDGLRRRPAATGWWRRTRTSTWPADRVAVGGRLVDLRTPDALHEEVYVPLHGAHQADNAAVAVAAVEAFLGRRPGRRGGRGGLRRADPARPLRGGGPPPHRGRRRRPQPRRGRRGRRHPGRGHAPCPARCSWSWACSPAATPRRCSRPSGRADAGLLVVCTPDTPRAMPAAEVAAAAERLGAWSRSCPTRSRPSTGPWRWPPRTTSCWWPAPSTSSARSGPHSARWRSPRDPAQPDGPADRPDPPQGQRPVLVRQSAASSSAATAPPSTGSAPARSARGDRSPTGSSGPTTPSTAAAAGRDVPDGAGRRDPRAPCAAPGRPRPRSSARWATRSPPGSPPRSSTPSATSSASTPAATRARWATASRRYPKSICTSVNEVICHGIPDSRPLRDGDIVNLDVTLFREGVHGDTNATFLVGTVDPSSCRRWSGSPASALQRASRRCARAGPSSDIGRAIQDPRRGRRASAWCGPSPATASATSSTPGLHILHYHDPRDAVTVMEPGMTFTIEPMIAVGAWQHRHVGRRLDGGHHRRHAARPSSSTPWSSPTTGPRS